MGVKPACPWSRLSGPSVSFWDTLQEKEEPLAQSL